MTPHEKAVAAVNTRLERLQANLREAKSDTVQRFLFQSIIVTLAVVEALNDYIRRVGQHAQRRHGELKQANDTLAAQHAALLKTGQAQLENLKANPTDRAIRKEIEQTQQAMAAIQKNLRRDTNALQRELAPVMTMIDELAVTVRRMCEADSKDALKRVLTTIIGQARDFYRAQGTEAARNIIDAPAWENAVTEEFGAAGDFYDAYARVGHQATIAIELITMALADAPPQSTEEATQRANEAVAARLKDITARITAPASEASGEGGPPAAS